MSVFAASRQQVACHPGLATVGDDQINVGATFGHVLHALNLNHHALFIIVHGADILAVVYGMGGF